MKTLRLVICVTGSAIALVCAMLRWLERREAEAEATPSSVATLLLAAKLPMALNFVAFAVPGLISVAAMMLFARRYRSHVPDELPGAALPA